jgi:hypothetical protein
MTKDETYYFHQTPEELCKELIKKIQIEDKDTILEPFKGEGSFYKNFPSNTVKYYTEIEEGLDYKSFDKNVDWVISNPPFRLDDGNTRINSFYSLLEYYSTRVNKGIAFLGNDYCFSTLNPRRIKKLEDNGLYLHKVIVCNVKKWRGRYFFLIFLKNKPTNFFDYIPGSF